jgi:hypothetical protein
MIPLSLITLGLILAGSGFYQLKKPKLYPIEQEEKEIQTGFILVGIIFVFLGMFILLLK